MHRLTALALALLLVPCALAAQNGSAAAKIRSATSAAPSHIAADAAVLDWPASQGADFAQLRAGTNGWTCLPDYPGTEGNDPQCIDETFLAFIRAYAAGEQPRIRRLGFGYMIAPGGAHSSNTDPYATGPTADNEWGHDGPHLMVVVPDVRALDGLPTQRETGGPYVMWRGTPYAHIMMPIAVPQR